MKLRLAVLGTTVLFALACGGASLDSAAFQPSSFATGGTDVCPSGAISGGPDIQAGEKVTLVAIHKEDAYASAENDRKLPQAGRVPSGGSLTQTEGCWYGGDFTADNGDSYYFYKAAFKR